MQLSVINLPNDPTILDPQSWSWLAPLVVVLIVVKTIGSEVEVTSWSSEGEIVRWTREGLIALGLDTIADDDAVPGATTSDEDVGYWAWGDVGEVLGGFVGTVEADLSCVVDTTLSLADVANAYIGQVWDGFFPQPYCVSEYSGHV